MSVALHTRVTGMGRPLIAMAPLGLDGGAFDGFGQTLARRGWRTIAVDLPGFGRTPAHDPPLTPAVLAEPVIALARSLAAPPVVTGVSLGGRVALEAALLEPATFAGVIAIAPALPWVRLRPLFQLVNLFDPAVAASLPLECLWPQLRWLARALETLPWLRDDELAQAGARLVYNLSCPATRVSFLSAARELALDPPHGEHGLWTRLATLAIPTAFVWCERDRLVSIRFAGRVARTCPGACQVVLPCAGHWLNGPHHRCLGEAVATLLATPLATVSAGFATAPCLVGRTPSSGYVPVTEVGHA